MTPDRRLNQLEPLVADVLQKVDRLIEGQGRLIDNILRVEQRADLVAKGVADLTLITQRQYDDLRSGQQLLHDGQQTMQTGLNTLQVDQQLLQDGQQTLQTSLNTLQVDQQVLQTGLNTLQVDQQALQDSQQTMQASLNTLRTEQQLLQDGQNAILQYLKEKLP